MRVAPTVRIGFFDAITDIPSWTSDVSAYVQAVSIRRGRQHELARVEPGSAAIRLANHDARFDPDNTASAYAGLILPGKPIYITISGGLFAGYIDSYRYQYSGNNLSWVDVTATDGLKLLALAEFNGSTYPQQVSGARISAILSDINWAGGVGVYPFVLDVSLLDLNTYLAPTGIYISSGNSSVQSATVSVSALEHIRAVETAEHGAFWFTKSGQMAFYGRHDILKYGPRVAFSNVPGSTLGATCDASTITLPIANITFEYDDARIENDLHVTLDGSTTLTQETDTASIATYFRRTHNQDGLILTSTTEARSWAQWYLQRTANPAKHARSLVVDLLKLQSDTRYGVSGMTPLVAVESLEIASRVNVEYRVPGSTVVQRHDGIVDALNYSFSISGTPTLTITTSPVSDYSAWRLDSTVYGPLGSTTTRLAIY